MNSATFDCFGLNIHCDPGLNGGGQLFYKQLTLLVNNLKFNNALEMWAGPGFIGYSLLHLNIVDRITFSDINSDAMDLCRKTARLNNLDNTSFIISDLFDNFTDQKFDLIIGNPPHYHNNNYRLERLYRGDVSLRAIDNQFSSHKRFFNTVGQHLSDDGIILLVENIWQMGLSTFQKELDSNGLQIVCHDLLPDFDNLFYMMISKTN